MLEEREKLSRDIVAELSQPLIDLDAEVYRITKVIKPNKQEYYILEFGYPVSMGERGFTGTCFFDELPDKSQIRKYCIEEIKSFISLKDNFWADAYEADAVKKLKKIIKKLNKGGDK
jgi:hypothetical protein